MIDRSLYMYEDELPPWISQETYDNWYILSYVEDGVRVGPNIQRIIDYSFGLVPIL